MLMGCTLTYTSCGDDDDDDEPKQDNKNEQPNNEQPNNNSDIGEQTTDASIAGFIPEEYKGKKVAAWYFNPSVDESKNKSEALYCFDDGTLLVTAISDGTKIIEFKGNYKITSGDFENGTATISVSMMGVTADVATFKIEKGVIVEQEGRYGYTKQDNSKIPVYAKADKDESEGSQHGENIDEIIQPFLPTAYAGKKVAAWYALTNIENDRTKTESVFLFDDGTVVKTTFKFKSHDNTLVREIDMEATYTLTGDYENGTVTVKAPTGDTFEALINDGVLSVPVMGNDKFKKQDNAKLPDDSEPTDGDNQGGNEQQAGEVNSFFPAEYSMLNTVAWFYSEQGGDTDALFFLDGGICIQTSIMSGQKLLMVKAAYSLVKGDFYNGTVRVVTTNMGTMETTIVNGVITDPDPEGDDDPYIKMDNNALPPVCSDYEDATDESGYEDDYIDFDIVMRDVENITVTGGFAKAYIDGFAGLTNFDRSAITSIGFCIAHPDEGFPTINNRFVAADGLNADGSFEATINRDDLRYNTWQICAVIQYNGEEFYSDIQEFSTNIDDNGGGNGDNGGNGNTSDIDLANFKAYLPAEYAGKNVAAWFENRQVEEEKGKCKILATFLFDDATFVVTKHKWSNGSEETEIEAAGTYELDGTNLIATLQSGGTMVFAIDEKGGFSMGEDRFDIQDNDNVPTATK